MPQSSDALLTSSQLPAAGVYLLRAVIFTGSAGRGAVRGVAGWWLYVCVAMGSGRWAVLCRRVLYIVYHYVYSLPHVNINFQCSQKHPVEGARGVEILVHAILKAAKAPTAVTHHHSRPSSFRPHVAVVAVVRFNKFKIFSDSLEANAARPPG